MERKSTEKSHFDMANRIYKQIKDGPKEFVRLYRVYHPVYEVSVNIETQDYEESYHIIEKYMDKLVCGYLGDNKQLDDGIFIKSKDELFELLGIDQQAYEIANRFYNDLITAGHFEEIPGVGIRGLKAAHASIKLEKRVNSSTVKEKKLFDQFSAKLMPGDFYDLKKYSRTRDAINEESPLSKYSVWLKPKNTVLGIVSDLDQKLRNFDYVNYERIERGLPQGFKGMRIAKEEPLTLAFYPYYLAVFMHNNRLEFQAFRVDNGNPIKWVGEQYYTPEYRAAFDLIKSLTNTSENDVINPLNKSFKLKDGPYASDIDGVTFDRVTKNYIWELQDWQIANLLGLGEDKKFKRASSLMIAHNEIACMTSVEAGKIVFIHKSEEQKKLLIAAASLETEEERRALYAEYIGVSDQDTDETSENMVE